MARILIAEDDRAIVRGLVENFEFEGHAVAHVARGDEVLDRIEADPPDLLVLDVMLPGLSGFDVCRRLRSRDARLPVLMLTARSDDVDKVMGLDLGADDYLTKPFSLSELLARVRALLRRADHEGSRALTRTLAFGDVVVDFDRYETTRGGQPVHLTAKEYAVLDHLSAQAGAAVRRDALIGLVWGEDVSVTNRTVDTHMLQLRQKLEPDPASPRYLLTVHGVGYRFVTSS